MRVYPDKITKTEIKSAVARVRHYIQSTDRDFQSSALHEFDMARFEYRDHVVQTASDLRHVLAHQADASADGARADAIRLVALGEIINALACLQCNGVERLRNGYRGASWDESDDTAQESIRVTVRQEMNRILSPYGATVDSVHGDPRGHTVKLRFSDGHLFGVG